MKKLFHIIFFVLPFMLLFSSCDYLDLIPDNMPTIESSFSNRATAEKFLFNCYSYRPAWGDLERDPAITGSDEIWCFYPKAIFTTFSPCRIQRGEMTVTNPILNFWDGQWSAKALYVGIRDCNIFLESIGQVRDMTDMEKSRWIAEVKFLKAYYHYYLWKCYGPIPIVDKNLPVSASTDEVKVYRDKSDDVVDYIDNLIMEALPDLPDYKDMIMATEAGRVDKQIALSIRAEMLVTAASPLYNGNTDMASIVDNRGTVLFNQVYDNEKWKRAADACKEAIESCEKAGKKLYTEIDALTESQDDFIKQQIMLRQVICDRWNSELIWGGTNSDCTQRSYLSTPRLVYFDPSYINTTPAQWCPTMKAIEAYYSSNGVPIDEDKEWQDSLWYDHRYQIRPQPSTGREKFIVKEGKQTVYLHYNREPRFYAYVSFDQGVFYGCGKYDIDNCYYANYLKLNGYSGFVGGSLYPQTGMGMKKLASFKNAVDAHQVAPAEFYPFPVMRLADLYLLYAEAVNEYENSDSARAVACEYVDKVRARAGLEGVVDSWQKYSINPDKPSTQAGMREIIRRERRIEFSFEGKRYWDIRRWKEIDELNVQPKGWNIMGEVPEDFYKVVNVAEVPVEATTKDYFMPIKEQDIITNTNLVQNYGW